MLANIGDIRLYYEDHGRGEPVVLVHGLADTHQLWRYQVPVLAQRFRVVALDTRGHGQSDKPPGPYTLDQYADDLLGLLDHLGIEQAVLVGLSMGGGIVQTFALTYPQRARALGLISTSSEFPPETRERFFRRADIAEREGMAPLVDGMVARWFSPAFLRQRPDEVEFTKRTVAANDPLAHAAASRANGVRDWTAQLHRITCPVLYVGGELDPADATRNAAIYRAHLPDVEVHLLPGVSHLLPVETPETFNRILLAYLERVSRNL